MLSTIGIRGELLASILQPAHRTLETACEPCDAHLLRQQDAFVPKTAADIRRNHAHRPLIDAKALGKPGTRDVRHQPLEMGDVIVLGGRLDAMASQMGLIGPEVADERALNIPLDQAEILVTNKSIEGKELGDLRSADFAGGMGLQRIERGGVPIPIGLNTKLQRFDVLYVVGLKSAVQRAAELLGGVVVSQQVFDDTFARPQNKLTLVRGGTKAELENAVAAFPDAKVQTKAEYVDAQTSFVSQILNQITALEGLRDYLPTRFATAWSDLLASQIDWSAMTRGVFSALGYALVFAAAAVWRFQRKDITS